MPENIVIILVLSLFFLFLIAGQHISTLLLTFGILGILLLDGPGSLSGFLLNDPFSTVASYTLTTVPLFVLMSQFILRSGIVQDMFKILFKLSRGSSGILGALTIVFGALMGAVAGSGTAAAATLGQVAVPELKKYGFHDELSGAIAASGGSLAGLIPPSILLIIYGSITQTSIGHLFMAAIIPGILIMLVFILCTLLYFKLYLDYKDEQTITTVEKESLRVGRVIVVAVVSLIIFSVIFIGIYAGVFTPTEAGGIGAFVGFLTALVFKKVNLEFMKLSFYETIKVTCMVFVIMIGAQIFGRFVSLSLLPRRLVEMLDPILGFPIFVIFLLIIFYFILFMFIESSAVILMTVPVTLPIIQAMGLDPIWFGVLVCLVSVLGLLTPPIGVSVFTVSAVTKIPIHRLFRFTTIYALIATIVVGGIITIFPELVTWLPSKMS
ncbi:TRAP transporter large permease [Alteribacillus sp. YIM 98480]|uniref:TRAP transporter large permease n=1 Tax=Alteribacillus sp. YIM 98480 TaxID=2606599 RepID=UPI00131C3390|nr:TRAP transporter large permease [Alteribacillus sp. YIM 98480]